MCIVRCEGVRSFAVQVVFGFDVVYFLGISCILSVLGEFYFG